MFFRLFRALWFLSSIIYILSIYSLCIFGRLMPKQMFWSAKNRIVYLILVSTCPLQISRNITIWGIFYLESSDFFKMSLINDRTQIFLKCSKKFQHNYVIYKQGSLFLSYLNCMLFRSIPLFCLTTLGIISIIMLSQCIEWISPAFSLRNKTFNFSPVNEMAGVGIWWIFLITLNNFLLSIFLFFWTF